MQPGGKAKALEWWIALTQSPETWYLRCICRMRPRRHPAAVLVGQTSIFSLSQAPTRTLIPSRSHTRVGFMLSSFLPESQAVKKVVFGRQCSQIGIYEMQHTVLLVLLVTLYKKNIRILQFTLWFGHFRVHSFNLFFEFVSCLLPLELEGWRQQTVFHGEWSLR